VTGHLQASKFGHERTKLNSQNHNYKHNSALMCARLSRPHILSDLHPTMSSYMPTAGGLLPWWLLIVRHFAGIAALAVTNCYQVAVTSIGNCVQAYSTLSYTRRLYAGPPPSSTSSSTKTTKTTTTVSETTSAPAPRRPTVQNSATAKSHTSPVTPLSARTFGTWTFLVAIVRIYAAYHLNEKAWYQMAIWTYGIALSHFMSEAFVYKTARPRGPWLAPTTVAVMSLVWLIAQYGSYVKS